MENAAMTLLNDENIARPRPLLDGQRALQPDEALVGWLVKSRCWSTIRPCVTMRRSDARQLHVARLLATARYPLTCFVR